MCDCCLMVKPDVHVRTGLHPTAPPGKMSDKAFYGFLCDECLLSARRPGSPENTWLLKQVGLRD